MEETYADPNLTSESPFSETPPSHGAANDLRAAAGDKAKQIAHEAGDKAKHLANEASVKAQQLKQTAVDKAQQFREYAGTKATGIKDTAGAKAQQFKQVAGEQVQHGRVKARAVHADTEEYIRQNPTKSVLTALGVGFVLGIIVRR
ncbi:DUF883 family protein [Verrucomicrobiaceae bacterium R5-34]|uniref:DUF883 family protein n=1 Tax=Oceaniferula flava TaxID=2800421 RepID=A0AAE2SAK6_9BACT|nr:hypothetical protein [Oceaniferula flavus]MBK1831442.1 DUF883 family protein [Verrucomicrobiaceae bacterium R5-34]MBK1854318.1 DUF883 family protein [Oceaniferula flavus]MBM1135624.1 DUF883 family protein [Oceaniferula flavus]